MTPDATARTSADSLLMQMAYPPIGGTPMNYAEAHKLLVTALTATASLVREELTKWLHHEPMCLAHPKNLVAGRKSECDCGLSAALRAQEAG